MFLGLFKNEAFIPDYYVKDIFEVDYQALYASGKRLIITDLDNTLISYKEKEPLEAQYAWVKEMKDLGFEVILVSNNSHEDRVKHFAELLGVKWLNKALKPLKKGFKKALTITDKKYEINEVVTLGDQLMTDILGSRRMNFTSILVKAVDKKSDILPTRINRKFEKHVLKVLEKKEKEAFERVLRAYVNDNGN